jgi:hypothetical protein
MTRSGWISNLRKACERNKDPYILNRYREGGRELTYFEAEELFDILRHREYSDVYKSMQLFSDIMDNQREQSVPQQTEFDIYETRGFDPENSNADLQIYRTYEDLRPPSQQPINKRLRYDPDTDRYVEKEMCIIL